MRRYTWVLLCVLAATALVACGGGEQAEPAEQASTPEPPVMEQAEVVDSDLAGLDENVRRAVTIARAIRQAPDATEDILARNGMTAEEFEALVYEISLDPDLAKAYAAAME